MFICLIKFAKQNIQQSPALLEILRIRLVGGKVLKLCPTHTLPPPPSPASLQFLYFIIGSLLYLFLGHRPHFLTWKICRLEGWEEVDNAKVGDRSGGGGAGGERSFEFYNSSRGYPSGQWGGGKQDKVLPFCGIYLTTISRMCTGHINILCVTLILCVWFLVNLSVHPPHLCFLKCPYSRSQVALLIVNCRTRKT